MMSDEELEAVVRRTVDLVYKAIFGHHTMTATEMRCAWAMVVEKLLFSITVEARSQLYREQLGSILEEQTNGHSTGTNEG